MVALGMTLIVLSVILLLSGIIDFENAPIVEANTIFVRVVGIVQILLAIASCSVGFWIFLGLIF